MYHNLIREEVPCWYDLSWDNKRCSIILKIHKDFVTSLDWMGSKSPIVEEMKEEFEFESFSSDFSKNLGFDDVFKFEKETEHFYSYLIEMPSPSIAPCETCSLQMEFDFPDQFSDILCPECWGRKQRIDTDWQTAYAISATFTIFFFLPYNPAENPVSFTYPQLINIQTCTLRDMHGGSLSGGYLYPTGKWLASHKPGFEITSIKEAMISAYEKMHHEKQDDMNRICNFKATIDYENGWLNTSCPGDACGLHPERSPPNNEFGYRFSCHNVDTPFQQLTLLTGLAALCDEVRKSP